MSKYIKPSKFEDHKFPVTFIVGARGVGKTINSLAENLKRCYEAKTMFIYLRRYQTEIDTLGLNLQLLSDLIKCDVTIDLYKDDSGRVVKVLMVNDVPTAYLLALSVASKYKSNDYSRVDKIIYDEFIDIKGRELKNETFLFINFAMTVFRDFSKYNVLFLSNATNLYNCYFLDLEILPKSRITKFKDKGIKIVMYETSSELDKERLSTVLAKQVEIIEGEQGSSLSNNFDNEFNDFLTKLNKNCKYQFTLALNNDKYGVYYDTKQDIYIISPKYDRTNKNKYACTYEDSANDFPVITPILLGNLKANFERGTLYFTDPKTRTRFIKYIKKGSVYYDA